MGTVRPKVVGHKVTGAKSLGLNVLGQEVSGSQGFGARCYWGKPLGQNALRPDVLGHDNRNA